MAQGAFPATGTGRERAGIDWSKIQIRPSYANAGTHDWVGPFAIVLECLCWAIDNNLTRHVSASDALFVAGAKGAVAGSVNVALAFALGASLPGGPVLLGTLAVGLQGYGITLVLFVLALRGLGTARTGAYFRPRPSSAQRFH